MRKLDFAKKNGTFEYTDNRKAYLIQRGSFLIIKNLKKK